MGSNSRLCYLRGVGDIGHGGLYLVLVAVELRHGLDHGGGQLPVGAGDGDDLVLLFLDGARLGSALACGDMTLSDYAALADGSFVTTSLGRTGNCWLEGDSTGRG